MKNCVKFFLIFIFIFNLFGFLNFKNKKKEAVIDIKKGYSVKKIASILEENDVINSKFLFILWVKFNGLEKKFHDGRYVLSQNMSFPKMIEEMKKEYKINRVKILIPEGFRAFEIAEKLSENGIGNKEKYLQIIKDKKLEGYLFPDTYFLTNNMTENEVLSIMEQRFYEKVEPIFKNAKEKNLYFDEKSIIIIASLIEKEAFLDIESIS